MVARENATLVEHWNLLNECLPKEVQDRSLSAQSQSSNGFDENLIHKWVNNSLPQYSLTESDSVISESPIISSHKWLAIKDPYRKGKKHLSEAFEQN